MKRFLRTIPNRTYFRAPGRWTPYPQEAFNFESLNEALELVERAGYRNMEMAFAFDRSNRLESVRLDTLEGLEV